MTTPSDRRRFGAYPYNDLGKGIPTAEASYAEGYDRGLTWTAPWQPGGPFVGDGPTDTQDADLNAFRKAQRENRDAWLRGFADGCAAART